MLAKVLSIKPGVGLCVIQSSVYQAWSRSEQVSVCYPRVKPGVGQSRLLSAIHSSVYLLCLEYVRIRFCELSEVVSIWPGGGQSRFLCAIQGSVKPGGGQNKFLCAIQGSVC